ncbi:unnamed protein product [Prunus armeniaca]|uniref:Uncharacterized protein n=1 Tax=Prunus armeniaca TaxID=36596 RepID=A0A6J5WUZ5_PRUAR|nr:unnamed protein product [Prunus armeniaca]
MREQLEQSRATITLPSPIHHSKQQARPLGLSTMLSSISNTSSIRGDCHDGFNHHKTKLNVVSLQGNHEQGFASDFGFSEMKMGVVVNHC